MNGTICQSGIASRIRRFLFRPRFDARTHAIYGNLSQHARLDTFFGRCGVPDTFDGRFEILVLHVALLLRRIRSIEDDNANTAQKLFDLLFVDLDRALREAGAGDLSIGRKIKAMARAFYGRAKALDEALDSCDPTTALCDVLARNLYGTVDVPDATMTCMAAYVLEQSANLAAVPDGEVLSGTFQLLVPGACELGADAAARACDDRHRVETT